MWLGAGSGDGVAGRDGLSFLGRVGYRTEYSGNWWKRLTPSRTLTWLGSIGTMVLWLCCKSHSVVVCSRLQGVLWSCANKHAQLSSVTLPVCTSRRQHHDFSTVAHFHDSPSRLFHARTHLASVLVLPPPACISQHASSTHPIPAFFPPSVLVHTPPQRCIQPAYAFLLAARQLSVLLTRPPKARFPFLHREEEF